MIISEDPPFILFSMEKTGTSSMDMALASRFNEKRAKKKYLGHPRFRFFRDRDFKRRLSKEDWNAIPSLKHASPAWVLANQKYLLDGDWTDYFKACFVRNPLDRLLSVYSFHTQKIPHKYPRAVEAGSFRRWLELGGTGSAKKSMKGFVTSDDDKVLVDFIGKYENLQEDWDRLTREAGLDSISLGHNSHTKTTHGAWREVWTDDLFEIFSRNQICSEDLRFFSYGRDA